MKQLIYAGAFLVVAAGAGKISYDMYVDSNKEMNIFYEDLKGFNSKNNISLDDHVFFNDFESTKKSLEGKMTSIDMKELDRLDVKADDIRTERNYSRALTALSVLLLVGVAKNAYSYFKGRHNIKK